MPEFLLELFCYLSKWNIEFFPSQTSKPRCSISGQSFRKTQEFQRRNINCTLNPTTLCYCVPPQESCFATLQNKPGFFWNSASPCLVQSITGQSVLASLFQAFRELSATRTPRTVPAKTEHPSLIGYFSRFAARGCSMFAQIHFIVFSKLSSETLHFDMGPLQSQWHINVILKVFALVCEF